MPPETVTFDSYSTLVDVEAVDGVGKRRLDGGDVDECAVGVDGDCLGGHTVGLGRQRLIGGDGAIGGVQSR